MKSIDKFVQGRLDDGYHTPDAAQLYQRKWHTVFVYGTLKQGFSRHKALQGCPFIGTGWTRNNGWTLYRTTHRGNNLLNYPVILSPYMGDKPGSVYGEVYLVPPDLIKYLDLIESNGVNYSRVYRVVDIHQRKEDKPRTMGAWMYISERSIWKEAIAKKFLVPCPAYDKGNGMHQYIFKKDHECPDAASATTLPMTARPF